MRKVWLSRRIADESKNVQIETSVLELFRFAQCSATVLTNSTTGAAADVGLLQQQRREVVVQVVGEVVDLADVDSLVIRRVRRRLEELKQADLREEVRGVEGGLPG